MNLVFARLQTLSHCELITDDGIRQLAAGSCAAESLSVLELDNCPLITDATLEHLTSCHNLQRIELYDCQLISRNAIRKLRVSGSLKFVELNWSFARSRLFYQTLKFMLISRLSHHQSEQSLVSSRWNLSLKAAHECFFANRTRQTKILSVLRNSLRSGTASLLA